MLIDLVICFRSGKGHQTTRNLSAFHGNFVGSHRILQQRQLVWFGYVENLWWETESWQSGRRGTGMACQRGGKVLGYLPGHSYHPLLPLAFSFSC